MFVLCKCDEAGHHPLYDTALPWEFFGLPNEARWGILRIPTYVWEQVEDDARFHRIPMLSRTAKNLPQKVKDYLAARGIDYDPHESIADILVKLTGNEDFGRD